MKKGDFVAWSIVIVVVLFLGFFFIKGFFLMQELESIRQDAVEQCEAKGQMFEGIDYFKGERHVKCKPLEGYEKLYVSEE